MEKRIQLPVSLYKAMTAYILDHYDPTDQIRFRMIQQALEQREEAQIRRNLYTAYKTQDDPETREMLRIAYLDRAGIPSHGRWGAETESHYRNGDFYFET